MEDKKSTAADQDEFQKALEKYDFIRLASPDLNGLHLCKLVPRRHAHKIAHNQCDIFAGFITIGYHTEKVPIKLLWNKKFPNGYILPDPKTLRPLPWANEGPIKTAEVIFENTWPDGSPVEAHPRLVARRQLEKLREFGFSFYSAFEIEFRVFRKEPQYEPVTWQKDLYRTSNLQKFYKLIHRMDDALHQVGIDVMDYTAEHGASMLEAPLAPRIGIEAADEAFFFRQAIKDIADQEGFQVSHMTKPLPNQPCTGWHFNHSLLEVASGKPVMFDESAENNLSEVMLHWVAGLTEHLPALTALYCPTVNCYRRLNQLVVSGFADWDLHNRLMSVRVKNAGPSDTYVELRTPSSASCPYHVLAATVAAGLDGLKRKITPPPAGLGKHTGVPKLPTTLADALDLLEKDTVMVEALGRPFVEWFVAMKRGTCVELLKDVDLTLDTAEAMEKERERYFHSA